MLSLSLAEWLSLLRCVEVRTLSSPSPLSLSRAKAPRVGSLTLSLSVQNMVRSSANAL